MKIKTPKQFSDAVRALQEVLTEKLEEGFELCIRADHVDLFEPDSGSLMVVQDDPPEKAAQYVFE